MSQTNAQAALIAASRVTIQVVGGSRGHVIDPYYHQVLHRAGEFKQWLDDADATDAVKAKIAERGTIEERVDRLERAAGGEA